MTWPTLVFLAMMIGAPALFGVSALATLPALPESPALPEPPALPAPWQRWGLQDRMDVVSRLSSCLSFLAVGRLVLPWHELPTALWGLAVALTAFGALTCAFAVRRLPWTRPDRGRAGRLVGGGLSVLIAIASLSLTAG